MMEWFEGVEVGMLKFVGMDEENIYLLVKQLLIDDDEYKKMFYVFNLYGDGEVF